MQVRTYVAGAVIALFLGGLQSAAFAQEEVMTTQAQQTGLNITIYNHDMALIKDERQVPLKKGIQNLAFKDVSAKILPESALLNADSLSVIEQNFEYDLLSPQTLLNKYIGKKVIVRTPAGQKGEGIEQEAIVLSTHHGTMLKIGNKIQALDATMRIIYDDLPNDLRDQPTLIMRLNARQENHQEPLSLSYLTKGMSWKADYVANLIDEHFLSLKAWVTLHNQTGITFHKARLQLIAGELNEVMPEQHMLTFARNNIKGKADTTMQEESLFEYHLYRLGSPTTLKNNQQKQVSLLHIEKVPYEKQLILRGESFSAPRGGACQRIHAITLLTIKNDKAIGMPMPAGIIRAYENDRQGNAQFIGEDSIEHTPENKKIAITLGKSFDVTAKKKQTSYRRYGGSKDAASGTKIAYEVVVSNAKNKAVNVYYQDAFWGDWNITKENIASQRLNSQLNQWPLSIPAKGSVTLIYHVDIKDK